MTSRSILRFSHRLRAERQLPISVAEPALDALRWALIARNQALRDQVCVEA